MRIWGRRKKSEKEDESINPFINIDGEKPLRSAEAEGEEPGVAEEPEYTYVPGEDAVPDSGEPEYTYVPGEDAVPDSGEPEYTYEPTDEIVADSGKDVVGEGEPVTDSVPEEPGEVPQPVYVVEKPSGFGGISPSGIGGALRGMLSFFTAIPITAVERDVESMNSNFWLAPIIGFVFAIVAAIAFSIGNVGSSMAGGILAFGAVLILNKFLHADGLIDTGDAIAATGDWEKKRRAMKDPAIGAGGIAVAILVLGGTLLFYSGFPLLSVFFITVAIAEVCGRNSMVAAAAFGKHLGDGMASDSVERTCVDGVIKSTILTAVLAVLALLVGYVFATLEFGFAPQITADLAGRFFVIAVLAILASVAWGWVLSKYANDKFGGVSGDVLGASVESGRLIALIVISISIGLVGFVAM